MRATHMLLPTVKEDPAGAEAVSHKLMVRAGLVRQLAAGVYVFLPAGWRVMRKIAAVIREEMEAIGGQEILFPALLPRGAFGLSADGGLLRVATTFDSLVTAPGGGYDAYKPVYLDSTTVVAVRSRTQECNFGVSSGVYAKVVPLAISVSFRKIILRLVVDPNCGYRGLALGLPGS